MKVNFEVVELTAKELLSKILDNAHKMIGYF